MRLLAIVFAIIISIPLSAQRKNIYIDKGQAQEAYRLLNEIRTNPGKYAKELGLKDISKVKRTKLIWNRTLAKVAEYRARDMADRNYFDHVSPEGLGPNYYMDKAGYPLNVAWLKARSANNFESIAANRPSAVEGVKALIIGKGSPGFMHRKHLLGMDEWNGSLVDIGIGFARIPSGAMYKTYLCVIIAKSDW